MKSITELISIEVKTAFKNAGYDEELGQVAVSNRPDLCEFQCNGAMAGAKLYHKAPIRTIVSRTNCLKRGAAFAAASCTSS